MKIKGENEMKNENEVKIEVNTAITIVIIVASFIFSVVIVCLKANVVNVI